MNGRLSKVDMTAKLMKLKRDIDQRTWYHEWNGEQRWAAQQALNNALDILEEYHY